MAPTIEELLDRAESLASMAQDEADSDDPAMLLNAAGKGWTATNLCLAAVVDTFTHERPKGTQTRRKKLEELARAGRHSQLFKFKSFVDDAFQELHLEASEQADCGAKKIRRRVRDVAKEIIPLARYLCS